ncbi:MAG TPA: hypothetical protein PKE16_14790 [Hyphomicrobium sp.]|nr:hypothetical protein [Hyphomicrobium sp.]
MRIDVQNLTEFDIATDGRSVTLYAVDKEGAPVALNLQVAQLGLLAMTLPNLIDAAIRRQYGDLSCRFTYPLESWIIEQALDPSLMIMTLRTTEGFGLSFSLPRKKADEMSESLAIAAQKQLELITH